jgi:hypothetical protein
MLGGAKVFSTAVFSTTYFKPLRLTLVRNNAIWTHPKFSELLQWRQVNLSQEDIGWNLKH